MEIKIINDREVAPAVGSWIKLDARRIPEHLLPSDWDKAAFRFPTYSAMAGSVAPAPHVPMFRRQSCRPAPPFR